MIELKWNKLSITLKYNVGQLTEKRIERIINEFNDKEIDVKATFNPEDSEVIVFLLEECNCILMIKPDSITYTSLRPFETELNSKYLEIILDIFDVDEENKFTVNVEGNSETEDSHIESVTSFNKTHSNILDNYSQIFGVGYRFLIKNENIIGELRIEPFIADKSKYYYQYIFNIITSVSINQVYEIILKELKIDFNIIRG